ncbi:MAG: thioredoxin family protein [Polyangiales bacterium]
MRSVVAAWFLFASISLVAACDAGAVPNRPRPPETLAAAPPPPPPSPIAAAPARKPDPTPTAAPTPSATGEAWGGAGVVWRSPQDAFAEAKRTNKPIALVVFTTWCPHCKRFQKVFGDPRIIEASKAFVMLHIDADQERDVAEKYAPDGGYFPRTLFLKPDATLLGDVRAKDDGRFQYFYDENDAAPLLAAMDKAKREIVR